jgi:hypothetical protein
MRFDTLPHRDSSASAGNSPARVRNLRRFRQGLATFATLITLAGCDTAGPPALPGNDPAPCELVTRTYAIRDVTLPRGRADVTRAFDLDGDGRPDDVLGQVMLTVDDVLDVVDRNTWATRINDALADGRAPWLLVVQSCSNPSPEPAASTEIIDFPPQPGNPYARVFLVAGIDTDGDGVLEIDDRATGVPAVGKVEADGWLHATLGSGVAPVGTFLDPLGAVSSTTWSAGGGLTVRMSNGDGGACDVEIGLAVNGSLEPAAAGLADAFTAQEALGGGNILGLDANQDGTVDVSELLANPLVQAALAPDLDLLAPDDDTMSYWPDHDGLRDSSSMYVRARAVPIAIE